MGCALHDYAMIAHGDRIAVGLSGGKDSLTLLWLLNWRRARAPVDYDVVAVYIDPGFGDGLAADLQDFCDRLNVRLVTEQTDHGPLAHSSENRENPCFLCARLRRKRLFEIASDQQCHKLALGHHKDDLIETFFLNILYAGEISTMLPAQPFFKNRLTIIRPLAYSDENHIRRFAREKGFPELSHNCPSAGSSRRQAVKEMLRTLYRSNRKIRGNIFHAMGRVKTDYLLKPGG